MKRTKGSKYVGITLTWVVKAKDADRIARALNAAYLANSDLPIVSLSPPGCMGPDTVWLKPWPTDCLTTADRAFLDGN